MPTVLLLALLLLLLLLVARLGVITAVAGKTGWFRNAGTGYPMKQWSLRLSTSRVDVTNFLSGGFSEFIAGFATGTVRTSGPLDPTITQFTIGQAMTLSLGVGGGYFTTFSGVLVDINASTAVDKAGEVELEIVTNGSFTPTFGL